MANPTIINLICVLILLHTIHAAQEQALVPFRNNNLPFSIHKFNIMNDEYRDLYEGLIVLATRNSNIQYEGVRVLPPQTYEDRQPPEWILVDIAASYGVTTLALRNDNLYLVGFTNSNGHWYAFKDHEHLIPSSIPIGFTGSYSDLGGRNNLQRLPLSKNIASDVVRTLLDYDHFSNSVSNSDLRSALAKLVLILCEAARFTDISNAVDSGWDSQSQITDPNRLVYWGIISRGLLVRWPRPAVVRSIENLFLVHDKKDFLAHLNVLKYPRDATLVPNTDGGN